MFPLLLKKPPSMLQHCWKLQIQLNNPGQIPVKFIDQTLNAKLKQLNRFLPTLYGQDKIVIQLGDLLTEMTGYKILGHWQEGNG
jgi:hypothetical protein